MQISHGYYTQVNALSPVIVWICLCLRSKSFCFIPPPPPDSAEDSPAFHKTLHRLSHLWVCRPIMFSNPNAPIFNWFLEFILFISLFKEGLKFLFVCGLFEEAEIWVHVGTCWKYKLSAICDFLVFAYLGKWAGRCRFACLIVCGFSVSLPDSWSHMSKTGTFVPHLVCLTFTFILQLCWDAFDSAVLTS